MKRIIPTNKFGLIALVILFIIIYSYFSINQLTGDIFQPKNYVEDEAIIGNLGGYHILDNISFNNELTYYRINLCTNLNRSTTLDETIITPYTVATQIISTDGKYQLKVTLSDTQVSENQKTLINEGPIIEINTLKSTDDSTTDILIDLNEKVKFGINKDTTGTIFIDILK